MIMGGRADIGTMRNPDGVTARIPRTRRTLERPKKRSVIIGYLLAFFHPLGRSKIFGFWGSRVDKAVRKRNSLSKKSDPIVPRT